MGLTQQELADAADVDLKTIYNLESGSRWPIAKTRVAVSAALGWEGDALADLADGALAATSGALAPTGLAVIDSAAAVADIAPFVYQVEMEIERAEREHGREPAGREIFGAGREADTWDHSGFGLDAKIRLIATIRWIAFKARNAEQGGSKTGLGLRVLPGG